MIKVPRSTLLFFFQQVGTITIILCLSPSSHSVYTIYATIIIFQPLELEKFRVKETEVFTVHLTHCIKKYLLVL